MKNGCQGRGPEDVWNEYMDKKEKGQKLMDSSKIEDFL